MQRQLERTAHVHVRVTPVSLAELADGECYVVATKPEAVAQGELDVTRRWRVRRVVEVALGVGVRVVDRWGHDPIAHDERADQELQRTGGAEHMPGGRFGGADVHR